MQKVSTVSTPPCLAKHFGEVQVVIEIDVDETTG